MPGPIILAIIIVIVIPVAVIITGAVVAALLGWSLKDNGERENEGSELLDLNV